MANGLHPDSWRDHRLIRVTSGGCIEWLGRHDGSGYAYASIGGKRGWGGRRGWRLHRWTWTAERGPIPDGMYIDHLCRNRGCVNPEHLRVVTPRQNILENSLSVQAANIRKASCPRCGGPYRQVSYGRICKHCINASARARERSKRRAAFDAMVQAGDVCLFRATSNGKEVCGEQIVVGADGKRTCVKCERYFADLCRDCDSPRGKVAARCPRCSAKRRLAQLNEWVKTHPDHKKNRYNPRYTYKRKYLAGSLDVP